jgi:hypothetical protein
METNCTQDPVSIQSLKAEVAQLLTPFLLDTTVFGLTQYITVNVKITWQSSAKVGLSLTTMRSQRILRRHAFDYCAEHSVKMLVALGYSCAFSKPHI